MELAVEISHHSAPHVMAHGGQLKCLFVHSFSFRDVKTNSKSLGMVSGIKFISYISAVQRVSVRYEEQNN
jgi:hypothetical protein